MASVTIRQANRLRVRVDTYVLEDPAPVGDSVLVYLPIEGRVHRVTRPFGHLVGQLHKATTLEGIEDDVVLLFDQLGLLESSVDDPPSQGNHGGAPTPGVYAPEGVVFLVTTVCNFRCAYCYAEAGSRPSQFFPRHVAEAAVRLVIDNAHRAGSSLAYLSFHGGGEPTTDFDFIRHTIEYARAYCATRTQGRVSIAAGLVTNGFLPRRKLEWIADNIQSVQVSFDGPPRIQDLQRPLQSGRSTHARVVGAIKYLEGRVPYLTIKSTVSAYSADSMPEIVEYLCQTFESRRFHLGPVVGSGRGKSAIFGEPDAEAFFESYRRAQDVADAYGRKIIVTGAQQVFPLLTSSHCGVTDPNFAVNVDGRVTSCHEVIYEDDGRAKDFHFGWFEEKSAQFVFDEERIGVLRRADVTSFRECDECFAKWHCAGECQARWADSGTNGRGASDMRCVLNRLVIADELVSLVNGVS